MKNKKYLVGIFVLVALLCLGIGYATVSKTLVITGTAATGTGDPGPLNKNLIVKFVDVTNAVTKPAGVEVEVAIDSSNPLKATFNINKLFVYGETVTIKLKIVNESVVLKAKIAEPTITNDNDDYFSIATNWPTEETLNAGGGEHEFTITVTVVKSATQHESATFTITFVAEAEEV